MSAESIQRRVGEYVQAHSNVEAVSCVSLVQDLSFDPKIDVLFRSIERKAFEELSKTLELYGQRASKIKPYGDLVRRHVEFLRAEIDRDGLCRQAKVRSQCIACGQYPFQEIGGKNRGSMYGPNTPIGEAQCGKGRRPDQWNW